MSPVRRLARSLVAALAATALAAPLAAAQQQDSVRAGATAPAAPAQPTPAAVLLPEPPISPRRAFLTSLLMPGYAQARLERPTASALFFAVEAAGALMLRKSISDLSIARRFEGDSVVVSYRRDPATGEVMIDPETGAPVVLEMAPGPFTTELVQARRTHREDWIAVLIFNHLIAGADAFVAAHLWDVPAGVSLGAAPRAGGGTLVYASFRW